MLEVGWIYIVWNELLGEEEDLLYLNISFGLLDLLNDLKIFVKLKVKEIKNRRFVMFVMFGFFV